MCIILVSTEHPQYPYVIASNRDEYLERPTAKADWWQEPNEHVLGGRDLQRSVQGTWLGITRQGVIAGLTNFREPASKVVQGAQSRGQIIKTFLTRPHSPDETNLESARRLLSQESVQSVGGFSLLLGRLRALDAHGRREGLVVVSNRTQPSDELRCLAERANQTRGLSNSAFGDLTWPKVVHGEQLLKQCLAAHSAQGAAMDNLLDRIFDLLSTDTLPVAPPGKTWETQVLQLKNSIFIQRIGGQSEYGKLAADEVAVADASSGLGVTSSASMDAYGTQKQTVILVDRYGHVTFVEKTVQSDSHGFDAREAENTRTFTFDIEGWESTHEV